MRRLGGLCLLVASVLSGCASPPPPPQAVTAGPMNSESWVTTQYPAGTPTSSTRQLPFQTPNSLPRGAANTPGR
ncbi:MAG: hypothetical protein JOZ05_01125 [Acetobacteraceae bacterium]|nr:hypothetical protein [Acetobacteraceae bacterium]